MSTASSRVYMFVRECGAHNWEFVFRGMCALSMGPPWDPCSPAGGSICWGGPLLSGGRSTGPTAAPRPFAPGPFLRPGRGAWQLCSAQSTWHLLEGEGGREDGGWRDAVGEEALTAGRERSWRGSKNSSGAQARRQLQREVIKMDRTEGRRWEAEWSGWWRWRGGKTRRFVDFKTFMSLSSVHF